MSYLLKDSRNRFVNEAQNTKCDTQWLSRNGNQPFSFFPLVLN